MRISFPYFLFAATLVTLFLCPIQSRGEKPSEFSEFYQTILEPFYDQTGVPGEFPGVNGIRLSYRKFERDDEKGAVVLVNGWTESYVRYREWIYDLFNAGFSVYAYDHRGQGLSEHLAPNPEVVYVDSFNDYIADLKTFVETVVKTRPHARLLLFGHSMGGLISTLYLNTYPKDFHSAVLSAPMFQMELGLKPELLVEGLTKALCGLGKGFEYALGQKDFDWADATFEKDNTTSSRARFEMKMETLKQFPQTIMGGASNRWVYEAIHASRKARVLARNSLSVPLLILVAGDDAFVKPAAQESFCKGQALCEIQIFPTALHELYQETDAIRSEVLSATLQFFLRGTPSPEQ